MPPINVPQIPRICRCKGGCVLRERRPIVRDALRDYAAAVSQESSNVTRNSGRQGNTRERIAAEAARIMAEDGIDDFALAKRKAVRRLGLQGGRLALPGNDEIEAHLQTYRSLYQAEEHPGRIAELQRVALDAMVALEQFRP